MPLENPIVRHEDKGLSSAITYLKLVFRNAVDSGVYCKLFFCLHKGVGVHGRDSAKLMYTEIQLESQHGFTCAL